MTTTGFADQTKAETVDLSDSAKAEIAQLVRRAAAEHKTGRTAAVQKTLEAILEIDPLHAETLFNLAILARDRKEVSNSEFLFRRAILADPMRVDAYHGLGELLYNARHLMQAITIFRKGLEIAPTRVPLMSSLARCYLQLRKPRPVAEYCRQILEMYPDDEEALWLLGWADLMGGEPAAAIASLDRLARVSPENIRGMVLRQLCLEAMGRAEAATVLQELTEKALVDWIFVKAVVEVYAWCGNTARGYELVHLFIQRDPDSSAAIQELCVLQMNDGLFEEVKSNLDAVLRLRPDSLYVQMVTGLSAFRFGDYETFFRYHDSRWGRDTHEGKWDLPIPEWDGSDLRDKALLIYSEQGIGDHVMYGGFFAELRKRARRITVETNVRLFGLFQRSFPDMAFVDRNQPQTVVSPAGFGGIAPYGDLPQLLDTDFENLPQRAGYLVPDPALVAKLRRRYQAKYPGQRLIGISWRSGNRDSAVTRSVDLPHWQQIFDVPGNAFVSLQYGSIEDDLADLKKELGVEVYRDPEIDAMSLMDPFAAQVAAMDLVISADNSTVHFAGALGVPCWAMLPVNSDWRWQLERPDAVWYASLALFRSRKELGGDWGPVITDIATRLAELPAESLPKARAQMLLRCMETMDRYARTAEAEDFARGLIEMDVHAGEAMRVIGVAAMKAGVTGDAVEILRRAATMLPENTQVVGDLAVALDAHGQAQEAEKLGRNALRAVDGDLHLLGAMGKVLTRQGRYDEATDYFARMLRQRPDDVDARQSLARLQLLEGETELAQINLEKALGFDSNARSVHLDLAEIMLRAAQPPAVAWEHFAWRFAERPGEIPRHLAMVDPDLRPNVWTGGKLRRQRLMLRAERTLSEQLLFMSRFDDIVGTARPILMEIDPRLMPMLDLGERKMDIRPAGASDPKSIIADRIQVVASLGDLAAPVAEAMQADALQAGAVSRAVASLRPNPQTVAAYRAAFQAPFPGRPLVGLSWREPGAPGGLILLLEQIVPFLSRRDIGIVLLQSDLRTEEVAALSQIAGVQLPTLTHTGKSLDFVDIAAQLAALDAVAAAEDLTAHLAAACGVKTIKLCGRVSHWAWGDRSSRCLWYPDAQSIHLSSADEVGALADRVADMVAGAGQRSGT